MHLCEKLFRGVFPTTVSPPTLPGPSASPSTVPLKTKCTAMSASVAYSCPSLSTFRQNFPSVVISAIPYILFLVAFAINPLIHVLPTAEDVTGVKGVKGTVTLFNVAAWESQVMPISVHRLVSSFHYTLLDLISTVPYMMHYLIPLLFPVYLAFTDRWEQIIK